MIEYQMYYECPKCGRKWHAFDSVAGPAKCRCSTKVEPSKAEEYNLSQVRHWEFWDQVENYGISPKPSVSGMSI